MGKSGERRNERGEVDYYTLGVDYYTCERRHKQQKNYQIHLGVQHSQQLKSTGHVEFNSAKSWQKLSWLSRNNARDQ